ncbi:replication factor C small subunit [Candidatus Woesearchaeota archaeon]|nr:replication factor C small subunit [Candidatus Woesearchaeota archaeon]
MGDLWIEKYRPIDFSQVKGHKEIIRRLTAMVEQKNIPHLLFAGPAGVGKTTVALIIAKKVFGETWKQNTLELNASDERGIDVVRSTIKDFARTKAIGTTLPKLIYLDECDALTREAQQALRRTMENYTTTARFILSCNYSSKIIDPIQSRCTVFRFRPLEEKDMQEIIEAIASVEKLKVTDKAKRALFNISQGDARKVENILQSCATIKKEIDESAICEIVAKAHPEEIREILDIAQKGEYVKARKKLLETMLRQGLSGIEMVKYIQKELWNMDMGDEEKVRLTERCAEIEFRMVEGSDEFLQLEALLASFIKK